MTNFETLLDIGVAILGALAGIIGVWMAWRLMRPDEDVKPSLSNLASAPPVQESAPLQVIKPAAVPAKPATTAPLPKATKKQLAPAQTEVFAPKLKAPAKEGTQGQPILKVHRVQRFSPEEIRIVLQNAGSTLIFLELISAEFNEVEIAYAPPIFRDEERYVQGTSMHISLKGKELQNRTYHFSIRFIDLEGNQYKQEVAGMGLENPIIEAPVRVLGPVSEH